MHSKEQLILKNGAFYKETICKRTANGEETSFVLISDKDPVVEYAWALLPSRKLQFMEPKDMIDYLDSESDATKRVVIKRIMMFPDDFISKVESGEILDGTKVYVKMAESIEGFVFDLYTNNQITFSLD